MLESLKNKLKKAIPQSEAERRKEWERKKAEAQQAAMEAYQASEDEADVLKELGSGDRPDAETLLAEGTYNLKRGNREKDPTKKLVFFQEALARFQQLETILPDESSVRQQVELLTQGVAEIESVIERYPQDGSAATPESAGE